MAVCELAGYRREPFRAALVYIEKSTFDVTKKCFEYSLVIALYSPQFVLLSISHVLGARFERLCSCGIGNLNVGSRFAALNVPLFIPQAIQKSIYPVVRINWSRPWCYSF